tara:strand:+ start:60030 stop:60446 length:417 start_codon:yes stop_codon:yes gene_type:complete
MRELSKDLRKRKRELEFFLRERNNWPNLPPILRNWILLDEEIKKITFVSQNPDNINGKIKRGQDVEYGNIEDMLRDLSVYEEYGIINIRPGAGEAGRRNIRISFMLKKDIIFDKPRSIVEEIKEKDFLGDIMGGKLPE